MIIPLHVSFEVGNLHARKAFVERGFTLNNTNNYGGPPLILDA